MRFLVDYAQNVFMLNYSDGLILMRVC